MARKSWTSRGVVTIERVERIIDLYNHGYSTKDVMEYAGESRTITQRILQGMKSTKSKDAAIVLSWYKDYNRSHAFKNKAEQVAEIEQMGIDDIQAARDCSIEELITNVCYGVFQRLDGILAELKELNNKWR